MPQLSIFLAALFPLFIIILNIARFFESRAFHKDYTFALILGSVFILPAAFIALLVSYVFTIIRCPKTRSALIMPPLLFSSIFALPAIPRPSFTDGLREKAANDLEREQLLSLFEMATATMPDDEIGRWNSSSCFLDVTPECHTFLLELRNHYPEAFTLNKHSPFVSISSADMRLEYGSSLTKHWGLAIVAEDTCPIDSLGPHRCQRVFENVWVYHDVN